MPMIRCAMLFAISALVACEGGKGGRFHDAGEKEDGITRAPDGIGFCCEGDARTTFLRFLALPANDPKEIERAAEGYALAVAQRDDLSPLDFCEESASF
jgi:hypothetical protein